ncbi:MAG: hypothetical protein ACP5GJ_03995 [Nanopusillaceae archaeon]
MTVIDNVEDCRKLADDFRTSLNRFGYTVEYNFEYLKACTVKVTYRNSNKNRVINGEFRFIYETTYPSVRSGIYITQEISGNVTGNEFISVRNPRLVDIDEISLRYYPPLNGQNQYVQAFIRIDEDNINSSAVNNIITLLQRLSYS